MFVKEYPDHMPPNSEDILLAFGETAFGPALSQSAVRTFWWPRFTRIAKWFITLERSRRADFVKISHSEISAQMDIPAPHGPFKLTAKADRIDQLNDDSYVIIDYKTGAPPSTKSILAGYAPQLPLEAVLMNVGAFDGLPRGSVSTLAFWHLSGRNPAGLERPISERGKVLDPEILAQDAYDGLCQLVDKFDDPDTAYLAIPRPAYAPRFNDYAHLARQGEWDIDDDSLSGGDK
jgi:ATP-dependent helicase/nuclease subunit B